MRMLAFSHCGAQKSHRATPDTLDTRMDALIMDRCRSEQGQIRSPKHRTSAISMTYAAMPADESRWRYHGKRFVPPEKPGREHQRHPCRVGQAARPNLVIPPGFGTFDLWSCDCSVGFTAQ